MKARIMESVAKRCNHFSLDKLSTDITPCTIETLIVINAVVHIISTVETTFGQGLLAFYNINHSAFDNVTTTDRCRRNKLQAYTLCLKKTSPTFSIVT